MARFICLNCFREWQSRTEKAVQRRCSSCHSRNVVEAEKFDEAVESVREIVEKGRSTEDKVKISDLGEMLAKVLNVTIKARLGSANVRKIRREILSRAIERS